MTSRPPRSWPSLELCRNELEDGRPAPLDPETGCVIDVDGEIYNAIRAIAARPDPRRDALVARVEMEMAA
jgi:hypothetical protein